MEQQDVDKKVQQLKKLKQYKETPEEYLIDIAKRKLLEKEQELDFSLDDVWKNKTERIKAQELLDEYLKINHVSKNNFEQLKNLVYYDIMLLRLQKQISDADTVDTRVLSALNDATKQALELRKQLGFLVDKSKESPYDYIQKLFKKFEVWREQNLDGRSTTCPHCKEIFFLKIRTDKYEPTKHPWFTGKVYTNDILWKWYKKDKKITKEEMAEVLKTHPDFIDWLDKHFYAKKENNNAETK